MSIQSLLPFGLERLGQLTLGSPLPLLLFAVVASAAAVFPHRTFGQMTVDKPPKLTQEQKRMIRKLEQQLVTPLNSKDNPGDQDTWFVIVFTDTALGSRQSSSVSGDIRTITREMQTGRNSAAKMTKGRKQAALLLLEYYYAENSAASSLRPTAGGTTDYARLKTAKHWQYLPFATEEEAKAFVDSISPKGGR